MGDLFVGPFVLDDHAKNLSRFGSFTLNPYTTNLILSSKHNSIGAAVEHFEKSSLVAAQEAALHDASILENLGYQMAKCDYTIVLEEVLVNNFPSLGEIKDFKAALKPICLRSLKVGKVHRGRILSGTLCCKSVKTSSAIMNVLEEDDTTIMNVLEEVDTRDATRLMIKNIALRSATTTKSQQLYPKGAQILIQEPYLRCFSDGMIGLLVENPTDILCCYFPKDLSTTEYHKIEEKLSKEAHKLEQQQARNSKEAMQQQKALVNVVSFDSILEFQKPICEQSSLICKIKESNYPISNFPMENVEFDILHQSSLSTCALGNSEGSFTSTHKHLNETGKLENPIKMVDNGRFETEEVKTSINPVNENIKYSMPKVHSIESQDQNNVKLNNASTISSTSTCHRRDESHTPFKCNIVFEVANNSLEDVSNNSYNSNVEILLHALQESAIPHNLMGGKFGVSRTSMEGHPYRKQEFEGLDIATNIQAEEEENFKKQEKSQITSNDEVGHEKIAQSAQGLDGKVDDKSTPKGTIFVKMDEKVLHCIEHKSLTDTLECNAAVKCVRLVVEESKTHTSPNLVRSLDSESLLAELNTEISSNLETVEDDTPILDETIIMEKGSSFMDSNLSKGDSNDTIGNTLDHFTHVALRLLGNKHFAQQDWARAIEIYTEATFKAVEATVHETKENMPPNHEKSNLSFDEQLRDLDYSKPENEVVMDYSNRAEAWLRLHHYERAWADSERALSLDPNHLKSLFRKGRALLGLGDYQQALAHFDTANARAPFDKDILAAIQLSRIADHQSRLGIYDFTDYYLRGRFVGEVPTCADYTGPVQVNATHTIGNNGRGLFLTKSVEAGDLLLVSNPLAMLECKLGSKSRKFFLVDDSKTLTKTSSPRLSAAVMEKLMQSLHERSKLSSKNRQRLLALCHSNDGTCPLSIPSMDLFVSRGQLSSPIEIPQLNDDRLYQIIAQNTIDRKMVSTTLEKKHVCHKQVCEDVSNDNSFYGLWVLPSFINHSCIPNVSMVVVGRGLFVYASRDLSAGEELLSNYFNVFQPLPQRREIASRYWGFSCRCARCLLETGLETSLKGLYSLHTRLEPNPTFVLQFSRFGYKTLAKDLAKELEMIETSKKLDNRERSWLQASYTQLYIVISQDFMGLHGNHPYLEGVLRAMELVCPSSNDTLEVGLLAREMVLKVNGRKTSQFKAITQQLQRICKGIYGKHRTPVLQSLIDRSPPNGERKV